MGTKDIIRKNLSHFIELSGRNKKDIASMVGISPQQLSRHLSGVHSIPPQMLDKYVRALNISVADIYNYRGKKPSRKTRQVKTVKTQTNEQQNIVREQIFFTVAEVAPILFSDRSQKGGEQVLRRMIKGEQIPVTKIGSRPLISRKTIQDFSNYNEKNSMAKTSNRKINQPNGDKLHSKINEMKRTSDLYQDGDISERGFIQLILPMIDKLTARGLE